MKKCLRCGQSYTDDTLNFCLNDGELLVDTTGYEPPPTRYADDSPPTLLMNQPRVTNPIDWPQASPMQQWQSPNQSPAPFANQYGIAGYGTSSPNQTLPTWSLVLGIASVPTVCCLGGILLGIPAIIIGFIGMRNADNEPSKYGGRSLAFAGMILGIITFVISFFFLIFGQLS